MSVFPDRKNLINTDGAKQSNIGYQGDLLEQLNVAVKNIDYDNLEDEPSLKINEVEKSKTFVWTRIYLKDEKDNIKKGEKVLLKYIPTNEEIEMVFGAYEKEGLNKDFDDEVTNYISKDDKKILCCMIDQNRLNKDSEDIPNLRTFFRSSRYYQENLFFKRDLEVWTNDEQLEYASISF